MCVIGLGVVASLAAMAGASPRDSFNATAGGPLNMRGGISGTSTTYLDAAAQRSWTLPGSANYAVRGISVSGDAEALWTSPPNAFGTQATDITIEVKTPTNRTYRLYPFDGVGEYNSLTATDIFFDLTTLPTEAWRPTNGAGGTVGAEPTAAGTWQFRIYDDFNDTGNTAPASNQTEQRWNNLTITLHDATVPPPPAPGTPAGCDDVVSFTNVNSDGNAAGGAVVTRTFTINPAVQYAGSLVFTGRALKGSGALDFLDRPIMLVTSPCGRTYTWDPFPPLFTGTQQQYYDVTDPLNGGSTASSRLALPNDTLAAGTWTVRFLESGTDNAGIDNVWSVANIGVVAGVGPGIPGGSPGQPLGDEVTDLFENVPSNRTQATSTEVRTYTAIGGYLCGKLKISGEIVDAIACSSPNDARIEITPPNGTPFVADLGINTNDSFARIVNQDILLPSVQDPAGTWTFRFYESVDEQGAAVDANWTSVAFGFASTSLPVATDLGVIGTTTGGLRVDDDVVGPSQIRWYKFEVPAPGVQAGNGSFFDVHVFGSSFADIGRGVNDTTIALYNANGQIVALNDDNKSPDERTSRLSFGASSSPRPAVGLGNPFSGQTGPTLAPGVYYLGVAEYGALYQAFWTAQSVAGQTGTVDVTLVTNLSAAACNDLDFNNDGNIEPGDVDAYFSVLGEGPCLGGTVCDSLDFNNDGNIEPEDVDAYFSVLGEGPCINN
jgi:hypothetical protein